MVASCTRLHLLRLWPHRTYITSEFAITALVTHITHARLRVQVLVLCVLDQNIYWYESLILLGLYFGYTLIMKVGLVGTHTPGVSKPPWLTPIAATLASAPW